MLLAHTSSEYKTSQQVYSIHQNHSGLLATGNAQLHQWLHAAAAKALDGSALTDKSGAVSHCCCSKGAVVISIGSTGYDKNAGTAYGAVSV